MTAWQERNPILVWAQKTHKGLRLRQLAEALGVTMASVYGWLQGSHPPKWSTLPKIEAFTGVTVEKLMGWFKDDPRQAGE